MSLPILDLLTSIPADEGPRPGSDRAMIAVARVLDVANGGTTVTVSLLGSAGITLPATASTWTGVETAYVLLDPDTGRPIHVLGPAPAPKTGPMSFDPPEATTNTVTCTAHPIWTGTHAPTGWNRFGAAIVGHPRDLSQGDAGTGTLTGLATYGQQIPAIGTASITRAILTAVGNGANPNTWNAVFQCATYTDAGPQPTGPQATGTITSNQTSSIDITALAAGLLAGQGIALVGAVYGGIRGQGESMVLSLECEVES